MADTGRDEKFDPKKAIHIAVVGRKRSGKSELAWHIFDSYPYDRVLIDPNGDLKVGETVEDLESPVSTRWPEWPEEMPTREPRRRTFRFVPNLLEPTHVDDMDRAAGMAFNHKRPTLLMIDEAQHAVPVNAKDRAPHAYRNLAQGRHGCGGEGFSQILVMPRPMSVTPLAISQADLTYIFRLPGPADRKRVADCIGYTPKELDEAVFALGDHEFLCFDITADELTHYPPLPRDVIQGHAAA